MQKTSIRPTAFWSQYIDRFYRVTQPKGVAHQLPTVLPGTGLELVFHLGTSFSIDAIPLDKAHIFCPRKAVRIEENTHLDYLAVRFKSGAFRHFNPHPHKELLNTFATPEDIWGNSGVELMQKIEEEKEVENKLKAIESFLMDCFAKYQKEDAKQWDLIIHQLYKGYNHWNIKELANHANKSLRQFERGFSAEFGITAKKFQRIAKFQSTVKEVLMCKDPVYLSKALSNGYYDQSHFIKEFQAMMGMKPSLFFQQENFEKHYFFKSYE